LKLLFDLATLVSCWGTLVMPKLYGNAKAGNALGNFYRFSDSI